MVMASTISTIIAAFVLPVGAALWFAFRRKGYLGPILLGVLTFFIFQVATRLPALNLLGKTVWYMTLSISSPVLYALLLSVTAGLFEEGGRWIIMRTLMKNKHRVMDGVAFGVGHGGLEAILLVGVSAIVLLFAPVAGLAASEILAGGVERIFAMLLHIGFSVLVLKSVTLNKPIWLVLAFVLHTLVNMISELMRQAGMNIWVIEAVIAVVAIALLIYVIAEQKKYREGEMA